MSVKIEKSEQGLLLPRREAISLGRSLRSAGIIGTSLLVMCINYQFKLYSVLYLFHLNNHLRNFGRNLCAILSKLFSRQEPRFPYYDVTERGFGKPLGARNSLSSSPAVLFSLVLIHTVLLIRQGLTPETVILPQLLLD